MPKIKHIALSTQDVEKTAKFYVETFGMKEVGQVNDPGTRGVFLTDGDINLAILNFKNDTAAGIERGKGFSGIHHIGFQVENLEAIADRLGISRDKMFVNLDRYGNTSAAAVAIALDEANRTGRIKRGDYVLMVVFGGGLTWASTVIEW